MAKHNRTNRNNNAGNNGGGASQTTTTTQTPTPPPTPAAPAAPSNPPPTPSTTPPVKSIKASKQEGRGNGLLWIVILLLAMVAILAGFNYYRDHSPANEITAKFHWEAHPNFKGVKNHFREISYPVSLALNRSAGTISFYSAPGKERTAWGKLVEGSSPPTYKLSWIDTQGNSGTMDLTLMSPTWLKGEEFIDGEQSKLPNPININWAE